MSRFEIGTFSVFPFDIEHDAPEPLGFLITSTVTDETLLYFTDTVYLRYKFKGVTHMMAEANYSLDILRENAENMDGMGARKSRILESHMSIDNLEDMLSERSIKSAADIP